MAHKYFLSIAAFMICYSLSSQDTTYKPPSNLRYSSEHFPWQVDLKWTPPAGWIHSAVDMWYDYDHGIYGGNAIGSCPGCPVEAAIRWDANYFNWYDTVYISKIRYVLREPDIDYALRIYEVMEDSFDTLLNYPLLENLVYEQFDTLSFNPILINTSEELWVSMWISSLGPGYPLAVGRAPAIIGYSNMIKLNPAGEWETLTDVNPDLDYPLNIGAYLETPNDTTIYPLFNIYRAIDDGPFEKITAEPCLDSIYFDNIGYDLDPSHLYYYITCVYADGESEPSDILDVSFVNIPESKESAFKIFPNPATDHVSLESVKGKIKSLSLIDSYGRLVMEKIVGDKRIDLDISSLNGSIYIIKIITEEGMYTSKLMVVR
jgi:hypothetical protein